MLVIYPQSYPAHNIALGVVDPEWLERLRQVDAHDLAVRIEARAVLNQHATAKSRVDREVDLGGAGMGVSRVHAAGPEETDGCNSRQ